MALTLNTGRGNIEVIARLDGSIPKDLPKDEYDNYLETLNEDLLRLKEGVKPTRFVMRREIPFGVKQGLRSKNMKVAKGDVQVDINYATDIVRAALIDIKNPDEVPQEHRIIFRRDKDGLASSDLINILDDAGVVMDLFGAYSNATASEKGEEDRKN